VPNQLLATGVNGESGTWLDPLTHRFPYRSFPYFSHHLLAASGHTGASGFGGSSTATASRFSESYVNRCVTPNGSIPWLATFPLLFAGYP
jgi:hypothetical protein